MHVYTPPPPSSSDRTQPKGRRKAVFLSAVAVGALLIGASAVAYACGGGDREPDPERAAKRAAFMLERIVEKVGADEAQAAHLEAVFAETRPQLQALRKEKRQLRKAMKAAMGAEPFDPAAVEALRTDGVALFEQTTALMTGALLKAAEVLDADQRVKLAEALPGPGGKHRRFRRGGKHGKRGLDGQRGPQ